MLLPCQTHCIIFIMSPRDMEFSLMRYRSLVKGAIRLPIVFSRLNVLLQGKKQAKVTYCVKLAILNSRCPEETHITNFTRMPQGLHICRDIEDQLPRFQSMLWPLKVFPSLSSFIRVFKRLSGLFTVFQSFSKSLRVFEGIPRSSKVFYSLSGSFRECSTEEGILEGSCCLRRLTVLSLKMNQRGEWVERAMRRRGSLLMCQRHKACCQRLGVGC